MRKIFILILLVMLCVQAAEAQSWQWAKRIGGAQSYRHSLQLVSSPTVEDVLDMTVDPYGNVYLLYTDRDSLMNADGHPLAGHGLDEIVLASFNCDGAYRWSKVIGTARDSDHAVAVRTDVLGNVYASGILPRLHEAVGHLDTDTTIAITGRTMFIAKWDSSGRYQWLRMPQPDTMSNNVAISRTALFDMDVDAQGNSYLLCLLSPGKYAGGGYNVSSDGFHVLMYGPNGLFVRGVPLQIHLGSAFVGIYAQFAFVLTHLTYNASRDRFIVTGYDLDNIDSIGSIAIPSGGYLATFNAYNGAADIVKTSNGYGIIIPGRAKTDAQDNIYIGGITRNNSQFNGVPFSNLPAFPASRGGAFVMKMDAASGNPVWTISGRSSVYGDTRGSAIALSGNKVLFGGSFRDSVIFATDSFSNNYSTRGDDCFTMQVDAATGAIQRIDTFGTPGNNSAVLGRTDIIYGIEADRRGNFYVCGTYTGAPLTIGGKVLTNAGESDAFVAKLGYANCNCIIPNASFNASAALGKTVRYTYTGTTSGLDSLVWDWGDGTRQKLTSGFATLIPHTFPTSGYYQVCVTAYTANCGLHTYCKTIPLSVPGLGSLSGVKVYPNPTSDQLTIEGLSSGRAVLYSMLGQQVLSMAFAGPRESMDMSSLPAGAYLLMLSNADGERAAIRVIKQ